MKVTCTGCIEYHCSAAIKRNMQPQYSSWVCGQQLKVEKRWHHSCPPADSEPSHLPGKEWKPSKATLNTVLQYCSYLDISDRQNKVECILYSSPSSTPVGDFYRVCCLRGTFSFSVQYKGIMCQFQVIFLPFILTVIYLLPNTSVFKLILSVPHPLRLQ